MKRFWLVLLALGLVITFSLPSGAVDVKLSGSFYAGGLYQDKTTVTRNTGFDGGSTAFYYQRLRVQADIVVSPGLKLVTRFDALERAWGATRSSATTVTYNSVTGVTTTSSAAAAPDSAGTVAENENIAFDYAYVSYMSPIGELRIGYRDIGIWGTDFANSGKPTGQIYWGKYFTPVSTYVWGMIAKVSDNSYTAKNTSLYSDRDNDQYMLSAHYYGIKNTEIGLLYDYLRYASGRNGVAFAPSIDYGYVTAAHIVQSFVKTRFNRVYLEGEVAYAWGDYVKFDGSHPGVNDMSLSNLQAYLKAIADFGPAYVGGIAAYVAGDDPGTTDKCEGGFFNGGREFNPALILFNTERSDWAGGIGGHNASAINGPISNAWFFQLIAGVKPVAKLDIMTTVSYANADKKPTAAWLYNHYGTEVDLTATYKITNNLSYMLGGGYLFTGNYFKGTSELNELRDNFLLLNKLTLTF